VLTEQLSALPASLLKRIGACRLDALCDPATSSRVLDFQRQVLACPYGGLGAIGRLDLLQNAFDVDFDGRFRETKPARDLLVGERARFVQ
jgi:hypothetical protein